MQTAIVTGLAAVALVAIGGHTHNGLIAIAGLVLPLIVWAWHLRRKR